MGRRHQLQSSSYNRISQSFSGRIGVSPLSGALEATIVVPVLDRENEAKQEVDLSEMTRQEVHALKRSDPFLFYSIPEMRRKNFTCQESDTEDEDEDEDMDEEETDIVAPLSPPKPSETNNANDNTAAPTSRRHSKTRLSSSCPAEMLADAELTRLQHSHSYLRGSVTRRHRVSTEAHHTLFMEDAFDDVLDEGHGTIGGDNHGSESSLLAAGSNVSRGRSSASRAARAEMEILVKSFTDFDDDMDME